MLQIDGQQKAAGRGAYVCGSQACIQTAFRAPKRINFLLRAELPSSVIARFEQVLLEYTRKSTNAIEKKEELL